MSATVKKNRSFFVKNDHRILIISLIASFMALAAKNPVEQTKTESSKLVNLTQKSSGHSHGPSQYFPIWQNGKGLGEVSFETSNVNKDAKELFLIGLKYLHNFEYQQAGYAFLKARTIEPDFAMAYWGQAMSHLHFMWYHYEYSDAEKIYKELKENVDPVNLSPVERGFIFALENYLSDKTHRELPAEDKSSGLWKLRADFEKLHNQYPDHLEAAVFAVYARMATRNGILDLPEARTTTTILSSLYKKYPNHPGIIHYIIHSNENTLTAQYAKESADNYDKIAYSALHALHMPAHYYENVGDWENDIRINEKSWGESKRRRDDLQLDDSSLEYHSTQYLHYAYMNAGRYDDAAKLIKEIMQTAQSDVRDEHAVQLLSDYLMQMPQDDTNHQEILKLVHLSEQVSLTNRGRYIFAKAYHAMMFHHDTKELNKLARQYEIEVSPFIKSLHPYSRDHLKIMGEEIRALANYASGDEVEAFGKLRDIADFEIKSFYEARVIKPPRELLAELLLKSEQPEEALEQFKEVLVLNSHRLVSLKGIEKAKNDMENLEK